MRRKMFWLSVTLIGLMATARAEEKPTCPSIITARKSWPS